MERILTKPVLQCCNKTQEYIIGAMTDNGFEMHYACSEHLKIIIDKYKKVGQINVGFIE